MPPAASILPDAGETAEQLAYRAGRLAYAAEAEALGAVDPYRAPDHLQPVLQGGLDLGVREPLKDDQTSAEAA